MCGTYLRTVVVTSTGCGLTALQLATFFVGDVKLSDHENDQHDADGEVERIKLNLYSHDFVRALCGAGCDFARARSVCIRFL